MRPMHKFTSKGPCDIEFAYPDGGRSIMRIQDDVQFTVKKPSGEELEFSIEQSFFAEHTNQPVVYERLLSIVQVADLLISEINPESFKHGWIKVTIPDRLENDPHSLKVFTDLLTSRLRKMFPKQVNKIIFMPKELTIDPISNEAVQKLKELGKMLFMEEMSNGSWQSHSLEVDCRPGENHFNLGGMPYPTQENDNEA